MGKFDVSDVTVHDGIVKSTCSDVIWMHTKFMGVNLILGSVDGLGVILTLPDVSSGTFEMYM